MALVLDRGTLDRERAQVTLSFRDEDTGIEYGVIDGTTPRAPDESDAAYSDRLQAMVDAAVARGFAEPAPDIAAARDDKGERFVELVPDQPLQEGDPVDVADAIAIAVGPPIELPPVEAEPIEGLGGKAGVP